MKPSLTLLFLALTAHATLAAVPPEANWLFPQMVTYLNYPMEEHLITTSDGYINTYFRVQAKNTEIKSGLPVVYLQHGLLDSGDDWFVNDEDIAPGYIVANAGFDVWVGNTRGNRYSLGHVGQNSTNPNSSYWDFSWQEMSLYDLPAAFQYIVNYTGQTEINYIGHSQGTSIMFAALSRRDPTILKYLRKFIAAGPVAYVNHCTSKVVTLAADAEIGKWLYVLNGKEFLFLTQPQRDFLELNCEYLNPVCMGTLQYLMDLNTTVDNSAIIDVEVGHFPAGTSIQNMYYWNQMVLNTQFQMYNYGTQGNMIAYNQATPPILNLGNINVPVHMFTGYYDELADPTDVETLNSQLTGSPNVTIRSYPYGHSTFMIGLNMSWIYDAIDTINYESDTHILE